MLIRRSLRIPAVITLSLILILSFMNPAFSDDSDAADSPPAVKSEETNASEARLKHAADIVNAVISGSVDSELLDIVNSNQPGSEKALVLLGRLYAKQGQTEKAEEYLSRAIEAYPLMKDYVLKMLLDLYRERDDQDRIVETARKIENKLLLQDARLAEINALLTLGRDDEAVQALFEYVKSFPNDWDSKLTFGVLLQGRGDMTDAVRIFKEVYISGGEFSDTALHELRVLEADVFTDAELLSRADDLYRRNAFQKAQGVYQDVLGHLEGQTRDDVLFFIGLCQFMQKKYEDSTGTFGQLASDKARFWQARSYYRLDKGDEFLQTLQDMEKTFPDSPYLPRLYQMWADELTRQGMKDEAAQTYQGILEKYPESAEDALWGLGWMYYRSGDYQRALENFSRLDAYTDSRDYSRYLYWKAMTRERLRESCTTERIEDGIGQEKPVCDGDGENFFSAMPADQSYYGYLILFRSGRPSSIEGAGPVRPDRPEGEVYDRIDALLFFGMKDEAAGEVIDALKSASDPDDILYLSALALALDRYREVIYRAEPRDEAEFLPYSYPRGYWGFIEHAAVEEAVDAFLIAAVIREESRYDVNIVSWAGAVGLMQIMPGTGNRIGKVLQTTGEEKLNLFDAETNISIGSHYLSALVSELGSIPLALAAYNAGSNVLRKWLAEYYRDDIAEFIEAIPYKETRRYVQKVLKSYWQYRSVYGMAVPGAVIAGFGE